MVHHPAIRTFIILIVQLISLSASSQQHGQVLFFQTDWGRLSSWDAFCERASASGYDGVETWFPRTAEEQEALREALKKYGLQVGFLHGTDRSVPFEKGLEAYIEQFKTLVSWGPAYINSHTGNDFFTFEQNMAFIREANKASQQSGIPIYHETHRGRFSYNLPDTRDYLQANPGLKLTLDISHWMVVHESLLENQDKILEEVLRRTHHIHARVGHAEGPQVNDPQAPEWKTAVDRHLDIWEKIIRARWETQPIFTVTTEFGPAGYMPTLPYTRQPVADQWAVNAYIMRALKERLTIE